MIKNAITKRYPLANEKKLHTFMNDAEGFFAIDGTAKAEFVTSFSNTPFKGYYEGAGCVEGTCAELPAGQPRMLRKEYDEPVDMSGSSCLSIASDVTRFAPGDQYWLIVRLYSDVDVFEGEAPILAECWNNTSFAIGSFSGASCVRAIEVGVRNEGTEPWAGRYQIGSVSLGEICDFAFEVPGAWKSFEASGGRLSFDGGLRFDFSSGGGEAAYIQSPFFPEAHNTRYNAPLELRNTLFFVMENRSDAARVRLWFLTADEPDYSQERSKEFEIEPFSGPKAYFFNISDVPGARGRLAGFRLEFPVGSGYAVVRRVTPEEEEPIRAFAGRIISSVSDGGTVAVRLYTSEGGTVRIFETFMYDVDDGYEGRELLAEKATGGGETVLSFPFMRGRLTRLSSQFIAFLETPDGVMRQVAPRFYIENYTDFCSNPYGFNLPEREVSVLDFGAVADAFTDDTDAIQAAVDHVSALGGGRVVVPFHNTGRYVITSVMLRSNVDLHLDEGTVLWQSQTDSDYKYKPFYGHDVPMRDVNWTHALHVATYPLIFARLVRNVKLTGKGKIRSMDTGSEEKRIGWYPNNCQDRIHCISVAFIGVENYEFRDVEIVRANNYHTDFSASRNGYIANVKLHEVKCVSGDGFSFSRGANHVKVERCFFESNDDAIVLTSSYNDPRGIKWWWATPGMINGPHHIEVAHCYLNSGGGKAICFITWGSDDPEIERTEIHDINVYDCVLQGGYSVGTWPDNPYNGKMPFDNTETDDWSPVKNVRIFNNEYRSPADMLCVKVVNFLSDTPIRSASFFQNADFSQGRAFWTEDGDVWFEKGRACAGAGRLYQGLFVERGRHVFRALVKGKGRLFVSDALTDDAIAERQFDCAEPSWQSIEFGTSADATLALGLYGGMIFNCGLD